MSFALVLTAAQLFSADWNEQNPMASLIRCDQSHSLAAVTFDPFLRHHVVWLGPEGDSGARTVWWRVYRRGETVERDADPRTLDGMTTATAVCGEEPFIPPTMLCRWDDKLLRVTQEVAGGVLQGDALLGRGRGFQQFRLTAFRCSFPMRPVQ